MKKHSLVSLVLLIPLFALAGCRFPGTGTPSAPTGLAAANPTVSSLTVSWNASTQATSYQVFRAGDTTGPFGGQNPAYNGSNTSFTDTGLSANTVYYYEVQATNSFGAGGLSAAAKGTTAANVYIGGSVGATSSSTIAVYWKNGTESQVTMGTNNTYGIGGYTSEDAAGNVCIAGAVGSSSSQTTPVFWKNGSPATMSFGSSGSTGTADGVLLDSSNTSTVAGSVGSSTTSQIPVYWVDGSLYTLPFANSANDTVGRAWGPAVNALADVFFAGYEGTATTSIPVFWKNGVATALSMSSNTYGSADVVMIDGSGSLYIGGSAGLSSTQHIPVYWKDGTYFALDLGTGNTIGSVSAGTVDASGNAFFAGSVGTTSAETPVYWENGTLHTLPEGNGNSYGQATGVAVDALGNLWISGNVGPSSGFGTPVYWEIGILSILSKSNTYGSAGGIAVGK